MMTFDCVAERKVELADNSIVFERLYSNGNDYYMMKPTLTLRQIIPTNEEINDALKTWTPVKSEE